MNIFEFATRTKLRFNFKGVISTEDLWDLSVNELDTIFKSLNSEMKQSEEESLLNTKTKEDLALAVKIDIVKHIVEIKLQEIERKRNEIKKSQEKQRILEVLADKQDEEIKNKSIDELKAMLEELDS